MTMLFERIVWLARRDALLLAAAPPEEESSIQAEAAE